MSFFVLNCQVVKRVDIFANPVFKNPGIKKRIFVSIRFLLLFLLERTYGKILATPMESFF